MSEVDAIQPYFEREYADPEGHKLINTFDTVDSVYGNRFMDKAALAFKISKDAIDAGDPVVSRMSPAQIKNKLEWVARRFNDLDNGIAISRSARIKLLAHQRDQQITSDVTTGQ